MPEPREPLTEAELDALESSAERARGLFLLGSRFHIRPDTVLSLVDDVRGLRAVLAKIIPLTGPGGARASHEAPRELLEDALERIEGLAYAALNQADADA